jgi:hypothetical protein
MYRLYLPAFFVLFFCFNAPAQKKAAASYALDIRIPSSWIEKVRNYDHKQSNAPILKEFEKLIKPHAIYVSDSYIDMDKTVTGFLNPIFANLDGETEDELICTLGWSSEEPSMAVFKKIGEGWRLLYLENYNMFYTDPDMYVANSFSKSKTFYFRMLYNRGSGVYSDGYKFYKLINNKVYPCLEIVHDAHITGWALFINQEVSSSLKFDIIDEDRIRVSYTYNFDGAYGTKGQDYINLIKGKGSVTYKWNDKSKKYLLDIPTYKEYDGLTAEQIACFGNFADDPLFIRAFRQQINDKLKNGTAQQKKVLTRYLAKAKKEKYVSRY